MVQQEYSRLHKLVTTQMQCEPAVQDLAIQTEFVAPPVRVSHFLFSRPLFFDCWVGFCSSTISDPLE